MTSKIKISLFVLALVLSPAALAEGVSLGGAEQMGTIYFGLSMNSISTGINSKIQNHDTVLFHSGGVKPSLIYRTPFVPTGDFIGYQFGHYVDYGLSPFQLNQGLVFDPALGYEVNPGKQINGWYGYASYMLGVRSGGLTIAIGPSLNFTSGHGSFAVNYNGSPSLTYETFNLNYLSVSMRLLIEGHSQHLIWGMHIRSVNYENSTFYYDLSFVSFYIGLRL